MLASKAGIKPLAKAGVASQALARPRSLHIHALPRSAPPISSTRTFLSRLASLIRPQVPTSGINPSPWRAGARMPPIGQNLSSSVRQTLSQPMRPMFLGHAPAVPRGITDVGLGTARKFSTARPLFQNLVENVPITARTLCEADMDLKSRKSRRATRYAKVGESNKNKKTKNTSVLKAQKQNVVAAADDTESVASFTDSELARYFSSPVASVPLTTTYLHIALPPTPTNRMPLHELPSSVPGPRLLPYAILAQTHVNHEARAAALAALFRRLDAAHVWDRGARPPEAYGDPSGLCTILRIEFVGWSEAMVRGVVGDMGSGWCAFEEVVHAPPPVEAVLPEDHYSPAVPERAMMEFQDPIAFVIPTLDFSSSFLDSHTDPLSSSGMSTPMSSFMSPSTGTSTPIEMMSESDAWSDAGTDSDSMSLHSFSSVGDSSFSSESTFERSISLPTDGASSPFASSWLSFSSDFARRASEMSDFHTIGVN